MTESEHDPLILTLNFNDEAQMFFNALRKQHFPPAINYLDAHLTLFHHLPPAENDFETDIKMAVQQYKRLQLQVTAISSIGAGVAFRITCHDLALLHQQLQNKWRQWLTPQDMQKLWPHVTIQNKVSAQTAGTLVKELTADFKPFEVEGLGLSLWIYKGGPWEFVRSFDFG